MMNLETVKARAMSASTMGLSIDACERELAELGAFIAAHKARIDAAWDAFDAARDFSLPVECGRYTVTEKDYWRYPSVDAAHRTLVALKDDDLYYWACSRATDLERRVGRGWSAQATLGIV